MPQGLYLTDFDAGAARPVLPVDDDGALRVDGWNTCSYTPDESCIVLVDAAQDVLDTLDTAGSGYVRLDGEE